MVDDSTVPHFVVKDGKDISRMNGSLAAGMMRTPNAETGHAVRVFFIFQLSDTAPVLRFF